ncbi:hypothetical protein COY95_00275, partial [Candidatus Woesearchaeota archaeon CG_4_10_14_0_8_um_filter_47_5]
KELVKAIAQAKESSQKRNFSQTVDFIITLGNIDSKNPEHQIELYVLAKYPRSSGKTKVCAFVGAETYDEAKRVFDTAIESHDFDKYQADKKLVKKLLKEHTFFVAQATVMAKVATVFGRVLGPKGKMPNPKAGNVFPPKGFNLEQLYERLQRTIKVTSKKGPFVQCIIGSEDMDNDHLAENALQVYTTVLHSFHDDTNKIKSVFVKLTMGKVVEVV